MPRIRELAGLKDGRLGFCVDSQGEVHGYRLETLEGYMSQYPTATGKMIEGILEARFTINDCQVRVHCFSKSPLRLAFDVADKDAVIEDNWWEVHK